MDPLSITASVLALLGAANNVYTILQSVRNADRGLQSLVREVVSLKGFLQSIEKALEDCRGSPYALSHIDPALWKESKIALSDCQATLAELSQVVDRPKKLSRSNTLFHRTRVAAELRSRAGEIASFREKISMSNLSLQTLLQVINVSLSLRSNESQQTILRGLEELKQALKKSSQAATVSYSALFLNESDQSLVHHLKDLIRAADDFHASASTTASTVVGSRETQVAPSEFEDDQRSSVSCRLPSMKMKQIETFLSSNHRIARPDSPGFDSKEERSATPVFEEAKVDAKPRQTGPDHAFSTIFTGGFSKMAQRALQQLDLEKAEALLKEALKWYESSGSNDLDHRRLLRVQLALCSLLQGNHQRAQELILELVNSGTGADTAPHQLLYALVLLQLHETDFEGARDNSKRLWEVLRETHCPVLGANDAMRLLVTTYQKSGNSLLAQAIEAEVPGLSIREPLPRMVEFLADCEELLVKSFGFQGCTPDVDGVSVKEKMHSLPIARKHNSLQQMWEEPLRDGLSLSRSNSSDIVAGQGLSAEPTSNLTNTPLKSKKRSWSHLRALLRTRITRAASSMDLSALYGNDDPVLDTVAEAIANSDHKHYESTGTKTKRTKTTHSSRQFSEESESKRGDVFSTSGSRTSTAPTEQSVPIEEGAGTRLEFDPDFDLRTKEWVVDQPVIISEETDESHERRRDLKHKFSFEVGMPDCLFESSPTHRTPCFELPNTTVYELMDTSMKAPSALESPERAQAVSCPIEQGSANKLSNPENNSASPWPLRLGNVAQMRDIFEVGQLFQGERRTMLKGKALRDIALEMESEIDDMLDHLEPKTIEVKRPRRSLSVKDSSASITTFSNSCSTDQATQPDCEPPGTTAEHGNDKGNPQENVIATSKQQVPRRRSKNKDNTSIVTDDCSVRSLRIHEPEAGLQGSVALSGSLKTRRQNSVEISLPKRLCRRNGLYKIPRKSASRSRSSAITATRFRKLFNTERRQENLDFGFNTSLYSAPESVIDQFTDLGKEAGPVDAQDTWPFAPWDIPMPDSFKMSPEGLTVKVDTS